MRFVLSLWICSLFPLLIHAQSSDQQRYNQLLPIYDSLEKQYSEEFAAFSNRRLLLTTRLSDAYIIQQQFLSKKEVLLQMIAGFQELEVPAEKIPSTNEVESAPITDYDALFERWRELIRKDLFIQRPVIDSLEVSQMTASVVAKYWQAKRKELESAITAFPVKAANLKIAESELRVLEQEGEAAIKSVDELLPKTDRLAKACEKLLKECETNYRNNGPNGFNKAYELNFPEIARSHRDRIEREKMPPPPPITEENTVHSFVEEQAEFPGGQAALKEYIATNLVYPERAKKQGIEGKSYVQFIVSSQGKISNVRIARGVPDCPECDAEAKRLIKSMPDWIPGKVGGKPVHSDYNLPISFKLN